MATQGHPGSLSSSRYFHAPLQFRDGDEMPAAVVISGTALEDGPAARARGVIPGVAGASGRSACTKLGLVRSRRTPEARGGHLKSARSRSRERVERSAARDVDDKLPNLGDPKRPGRLPAQSGSDAESGTSISETEVWGREGRTPCGRSCRCTCSAPWRVPTGQRMPRRRTLSERVPGSRRDARSRSSSRSGGRPWRVGRRPRCSPSSRASRASRSAPSC